MGLCLCGLEGGRAGTGGCSGGESSGPWRDGRGCGLSNGDLLDLNLWVN